MWNQLSSASSANSNRNGHENGHRIVTFRACFVFLWHFGHRIAAFRARFVFSWHFGHRILAFRARFGFGPFRWYIFGQVGHFSADLAGWPPREEGVAFLQAIVLLCSHIIF